MLVLAPHFADHPAPDGTEAPSERSIRNGEYNQKGNVRGKTPDQEDGYRGARSGYGDHSSNLEAIAQVTRTQCADYRGQVEKSENNGAGYRGEANGESVGGEKY